MIPKILHFIWLGNLKKPETIQTWFEKHKDWEIIIWTDEMVKNLSLINKNIYDVANKRFNQKSDILRLEILYKYGGVYIDADIINLRNIEPLLEENCNLFLFQEKKNLISNSIIGSIPNNPLIMDIILNIKKNYIYDKAVWKTTGPKVITDYLLENKKIIFPPQNSPLIDTKSLENSIKIYPYYYINLMKDTLQQGIFKLKDFKANKDVKYLKTVSIKKENIFGLQIWMGGKRDNYKRKINIENIILRFEEYLILLNIE